MTDHSRVPDVTGLLVSWRQGDAAAFDRFVPLVYEELRRVARSHLRREAPGHVLQTTALVHEVHLRLVDVDRLTLKGRTHFFAVAARLMRQILVDDARRRRTDKRGGGVTMLGLDEVSPPAPTPSVDVLALDEALETLSYVRRQAVPCCGAAILRRAQPRGSGRSARRFYGHGRARMGLGEVVAVPAIVAAEASQPVESGRPESDASPQRYDMTLAPKTGRG